MECADDSFSETLEELRELYDSLDAELRATAHQSNRVVILARSMWKRYEKGRGHSDVSSISDRPIRNWLEEVMLDSYLRSVDENGQMRALEKILVNKI